MKSRFGGCIGIDCDEMGVAYSTDDAIGTANVALTQFYDASQKYNGDMSTMSREQYLKAVDKLQPNWKKFFGGGIIESEIPASDLKSTMERLAAKFAGRIPDANSLNAFFNAIYGEITSVSYVTKQALDAAAEGISESFSLISTLAKVGAGTYFVIGGVALFLLIYKKAPAVIERRR